MTPITSIIVRTVDHDAQRYPTTGDWWVEPPVLHVRVSAFPPPRQDYGMLVAVHEIVEALLCLRDGIDPAAVDAFDIAFERARPPHDTSEPGDHPDAPYRAQHAVATTIERMVAAAMGVSWEHYEAANVALDARSPHDGTPV